MRRGENSSAVIAEYLYNDHAIMSEKRPAPVRRPRGGWAQARIAVSKKVTFKMIMQSGAKSDRRRCAALVEAGRMPE